MVAANEGLRRRFRWVVLLLLDAPGRILTLSPIAVGVALVVITVALGAQWVVEGRWGDGTRRRRTQRRIDALSGHHVICACGRVGRAVAREFEAEAVPFVVIDPKEELQERKERTGCRT